MAAPAPSVVTIGFMPSATIAPCTSPMAIAAANVTSAARSTGQPLDRASANRIPR